MKVREKTRLLRHDRTIFANEMRSALASWSDRVLVLVVMLFVLGAVKAALMDRPVLVAAGVISALAMFAGARAARLIARRMDFHCQDGILTAYALARDARRHYALSIHALFCAIASIGALIVSPGTAVFVPVFYLVGAAIGHGMSRGLLVEASQRRKSRRRTMTSLLQRPASGVVCAVAVALLMLLLPGSIEPATRAALVGLGSAVAALLLTMLDYDVIRYLTESGYSAGRIVAMYARPYLLFIVLTFLACLALSDRLSVVALSAVALAALALMTARILAYRVHSKRSAEILVSITTGVLALTGVAMPMLLPLVAIAILWHLYRRSISATWLLD